MASSGNTFQSILKKIAINDDPYNGAQTTKFLNPDIAPLPPSRRTWGYMAYLGFGSISNLCISAWVGGASLISLGLSIPQLIGVMIIARVFITLYAIGNGWMGAEWHIGFTVAQRLVLGIYGSYVGILIRILLSIIWYASQSWLGGLCVTALLSSWSHSFLTMRNTLPESAHMTTRDLIGFTVYHFIQAPLLWIRPEHSKWPVLISSFITLVVMVAITGHTCARAGGVGPLWHVGATTVVGFTPGWAWVYGIVASLGGISAGLLNQSDFTRFARKQGAQVPGITFSLFVPGMLVPILGILTASATVTIYGGEPMWNPLVLINQWMLDDYSAGPRAAAFFASLGFIISQLAENIMGNGYAAGMDLAGLLPKYINIRRGALLAALLSWPVQPWLFYNTASTLVATASSFSVFMGPLTGIMICDYFIVRRQKIEVSQLYTGSNEGSYYYNWGFNFRAIVIWVICFTPAMPGMIATLNTNVTVSQGAINYYRGNYLFGSVMAAVLYYAACKIWKIKSAGKQDDYDFYGTFDETEADRKGIAAFIQKGEDLDGGEGPSEHVDAVDIERSSLPPADVQKAPVVYTK